MYTAFVEEEVRFNNWNLGCNDLQFLAPHFKAIVDRMGWEKITQLQSPERQLVVDVGANTGDDATAILGSFRSVQGMCLNWGSPLLLLSIEPSPKVFCELVQAMQKQPRLSQFEDVHLLNIALSSQSGNLIFQDPGNEGGRLIGKNISNPFHSNPMTYDTWTKVTKCQLPSNNIQNHTVDYDRHTIVPTYTLDLLMDSLEILGKLGHRQNSSLTDRIFVLKIDTEGHDYDVLLGGKQLLQQKRVDFVIFETSNNSLLKASIKFMAAVGYECYLLAPKWLVPLHAEHHWYQHMDNYTTDWWGNALCAISGSKTMGMLWRSYHSDDLQMVNSFEILHGKT